MKSGEAAVHMAADLVQDLEADTQAGNVREDRPPIL